jgi:outer membrane protein TolC
MFFWMLSFVIALPNGQCEQAPLTLEKSIQRGLASSVELQRANSEQKASEDQFREAEAKLFPTLNLNASGGTTKVSRNATPGLADGSTGISELYKARLDLEQPLFYGGVITSGIAAAKLNRDIADVF